MQAAEQVTLLRVNLKDGTTEHFNLPDQPTITFADAKMHVASGAMEGHYDLASLSHYDFVLGEPVTAAIGAVGADSSSADFMLTFTDNANVTVSAASLGVVTLFDMAGHQVAKAAAHQGTAAVNIEHLAAGVYLVASDCHGAIKIIKK